MKATDDGYPSIILGYKVGPYVVMMRSLEPHADIRIIEGHLQTLCYSYVIMGIPFGRIHLIGYRLLRMYHRGGPY